MSSKKDELMRIATRAAQHGGVHAVSFRELGKAAGIKSSSVIYHFHNKDGLLLAITTDYIDTFFEHIQTIEADHEKALDRLGAMIDIFEEVLEQNRFCLCGMMAADMEAIDKPTRTAIERFFKRLEGWIAETILAGKGAAHGEDRARNESRVLLSGLEGALLLDKLDGKPNRLTAMRQWLVALMG